MDWLNKYLGTALAALVAVGGVAVLRKPIVAVWSAWKAYRAAQTKLHETNERLVAAQDKLHEIDSSLTDRQLAEAKRECQELKNELSELQRIFKDQVRATGVRDDINRQDRAYIRALEGRLREERIDFADIEEAIQRQFGDE